MFSWVDHQQPNINETRIIRSLDQHVTTPLDNYNSTGINTNDADMIHQVTGHYGFINISPIKKRKLNVPAKKFPIAVLELAKFKRPPIIEYGTVIVGQVKSMCVSVRNLQSHTQILKITSLPSEDKGFFIENDIIQIEAQSQLTLMVKWCPTKAGRYRECINFHDCNRFPFKIILVGISIEPEIITKTKTKALRTQATLGGTKCCQNTYRNPSPPRLIIRTTQPQSEQKSQQKKPNYVDNQQHLILNHRKRWSGLLVRQIVASRERDLAARKIQHFFRMVKDRRRFLEFKKMNELRRKKAATIIQASFRGFVERKRYQKLRSSVVIFQAQCRILLAKRQLELLRQQRNLEIASAIKIQKKICAFLARKKFLILKSTTIRMQARVRMIQARKKYLKIQKSILILQTFSRSTLAKRLLEKLRKKRDLEIKSAVTLQACMRRFLARRKFLALKNACIQIQSRRKCQIQRRQYLKLKNAAVLIQSYVRMFLVHKRYQKIKISTIKLQSFARMISAKKQLNVLRSERDSQNQAALTLQKYYRGYLTRKRLNRIKCSARIAQKQFRMVKQRKRFLDLRKSTILLQSRIRMIQKQRKFMKMKKSAVLIQSYVRMWLASKRYQRAHLVLTRVKSLVAQSLYSLSVPTKLTEF